MDVHKVKAYPRGSNWYLINELDVLVSVSEGWNSFALQNEGFAATSSDVLGKLLWDFVSCAETIGFLKAMFAYSRSKQFSFEVPYRFDSSFERRDFLMHIDPLPYGSLFVGHELIGTKPFEGFPGTASAPLVRQCVQCHHFSIADDASGRSPHESLPEDTFAQHVCDACKQRAAEQVSGDKEWLLSQMRDYAGNERNETVKDA